jgi:DNA-directed RNA polymerase subunit beta
MIDADSGEVVVEAGKKLTPRLLKQLTEKGVKFIKATDEDLVGSYLAEDIVNPETGEVYLEAGRRRSTKKTRATAGGLIEAGSTRFKVLDIDHINVGAYIRNTLDGRQERPPARKRCSISTA